MPIMVWDTATMESRPATQADLDELMAVRSAYARILARFQEDRGLLLEEIKAIRSRAGMPNDLMVDPRPAEPVLPEGWPPGISRAQGRAKAWAEYKAAREDGADDQ